MEKRSPIEENRERQRRVYRDGRSRLEEVGMGYDISPEFCNRRSSG